MTFTEIMSGIGVWIIILYFIAPGVLEAVAAILQAIIMIVGVTLVVLFRVIVTIGTLANKHLKMPKPQIGRLALLIGYVLLELFRRSEPEPDFEPDSGEDPSPELEPRPQDKIAWALATLGLTRDDLTPETLTRAYRQAMRAAHPDITGSEEDAVRINRARDAIRKHFGWT
jgi:hypothetical protein